MKQSIRISSGEVVTDIDHFLLRNSTGMLHSTEGRYSWQAYQDNLNRLKEAILKLKYPSKK